VGAQIKNFNAQAQIVQPKFLIVKTQVQIMQVKIKSEKRKRKLRKQKIKSVKCKLLKDLKKIDKAQNAN